MNKDASAELQQGIAVLCNEIWGKLTNTRTTGYGDLLARWQEVHHIYLATAAENLEQWAEKYGPDGAAEFDKIEADSITVEIVDKNTGKMFRRILPVNYLETANGLVLSGETLQGASSQIAFLSDLAMTKIGDLFGKGPDGPRCGKTGEQSGQ
jgi:hypothetical protein